MTAPRRALVEALFSSRGHATAEELVERLRAIDPDAQLSTVYRNLEELEELGVVTHTHLGHGAATYQLVSNSHAHFLCVACGEAIDAPANVFDVLATSVREQTGFEVEQSHFVVEGTCKKCSSKRARRVASGSTPA